MKRPSGALLLACLLVLAGPWPSPARAAGGGGDGAGPGAARKPEDPDYTAAVAAIKANDFARAIGLLEKVAARDERNADALNWLGYATRKAGDPARALPIYYRALAIDSDHRGAHAYIGEAYLGLDNLGKAKEHLAKLDRLCFFPCAEYTELKRAVQAHEAKAGKARSSR